MIDFDLSIFDKIKDKPESYNLLVTGFYRKEIVKYFTEKKVPVHVVNGYTEYIKMIYELHPENPLQNINNFEVFDTSTKEIVLFDYDQFLAGTQYLTGTSFVYRCDSCDSQLIVSLYNDKIELRHEEGEDCFEMKDYTVSFTVPKNGKMVVSDWLGSILSDAPDQQSLNSEKGKYLATKHAESQGFVHFEVGNSCPSLYKLQDGSIIVAGSSVFCTEESSYEEVDPTKYPGAVELVNVCTDLWWVTMASENHCLKLEKKGGDYHGGDVIDLEPGKWECTVHVNNHHYQEPYATFRKVK